MRKRKPSLGKAQSNLCEARTRLRNLFVDHNDDMPEAMVTAWAQLELAILGYIQAQKRAAARRKQRATSNRRRG